jgi:hypothetical protein
MVAGPMHRLNRLTFLSKRNKSAHQAIILFQIKPKSPVKNTSQPNNSPDRPIQNEERLGRCGCGAIAGNDSWMGIVHAQRTEWRCHSAMPRFSRQVRQSTKKPTSTAITVSIPRTSPDAIASPFLLAIR